MTIFCDLTGVLSDFDAHYESTFGTRPAPDGSDIDWDKVAAAPTFYPTLPTTYKADYLWSRLGPHNPVIVTSVPPKLDFNQNMKDKTDWFRKTFNNTVCEVVNAPPGLKHTYAYPGNILIENREKYRAPWEARGGVFILHIDHDQTVKQLKAIGFL